ncbi:MAG: hypothetical protein ACRD1Q_14870, partial [Vicinamibacterales bacterium]
MTKRRRAPMLAVAGSVAVVCALAVSSNAQAPAAGQPGAQAQGGRGGPSRPPEPAPRLADGTPNLGRIPGEKGVWNLPYITNFGERVLGPDGVMPVPARGGGRGAGGGRGGGPLGGGEGTAGGGRGGAKSEPRVPFMPWSA